MSKNTLTDIVTKNQVYLERLKAQQIIDFDKVHGEIDGAISEVLGALEVESLDQLTKAQLSATLGSLRRTQGEVQLAALQDLTTELQETAGFQAAFEQTLLASIAKKGKSKIKVANVAANKAYQHALDHPVADTGKLMESFTNGWSDSTLGKVEGAVLDGWAQGKTVPQVMQKIRGTKAALYKDGILTTSRREAAAMVRTATQHVAQSARMATWAANGDLVQGYEILATLDGRTSTICRSQDGKKYDIGKGPVPPLHVNCRSTTIPTLGPEWDFLDEGATRSSLNGYVPADTTYYEWLKGQSPDFIKDAIGPARAQLLLEGKLSATEFADLNLGKNFEPMTLQQMAAKNPQVFREAGLDKYIPDVPSAPVPAAVVEILGDLPVLKETSLEKARRILREKREAEKLMKGGGTITPPPPPPIKETSLEKARRILREKRAADKLAGVTPPPPKPKPAQKTVVPVPKPEPKPDGIDIKKFGTQFTSVGNQTHLKLPDEWAAKGYTLTRDLGSNNSSTYLYYKGKKISWVGSTNTGYDLWDHVVIGIDRHRMYNTLKPIPLPKIATLPDRVSPAMVEIKAVLAGKPSPVSNTLAVQALNAKMEAILLELKTANSMSVTIKLNNEYHAAKIKRAMLMADNMGDAADRSAEVKAILFRPTHNTKLLKLRADTGVTPVMMLKAEEAKQALENLLNEDIIKAINAKRAAEVVTLNAKGRAHYENWRGAISMTQSNDVTTYIHEMIHSIEYVDPDISRKAKAFVLKRGTKDGGKLQKLSKLTGSSAYDALEIAYEDEWVKRGGRHYMGKVYDNMPATELLTMGVERLWANPHKFFLDDPEYFEFIVNLLV